MKNVQIGSVIVVTLVVCGILLWSAYAWLERGRTANEPRRHTGEQVVMQGQLRCLPKAGPGPHTMECAYGLLSQGVYYGLNMNKVDKDLFEYTFEDVLEIKGDLVEAEPTTTYAIEGVIEVESIELVSGSS